MHGPNIYEKIYVGVRPGLTPRDRAEDAHVGCAVLFRDPQNILTLLLKQTRQIYRLCDNRH